MTPFTLAADPGRTIAYMRDIVGYGQLPGESSQLGDLASLSRQERATVLAWYWPDRAYDPSFDPFAAFDEAVRTKAAPREAQLRLRSLVSQRLREAITAVFAATRRAPEEVVGAICWSSTCGGGRLAGVFDATAGLRLEQLLAIGEFLGLRYIDPLDHTSVLSSWTSYKAEAQREFVEYVTPPVELAIVSVRSVLLDRFEATLDQGRADAVPTFPVSESQTLDWLKGQSRLPLRLDAARTAFSDRKRLADPTHLGAVLVDLLSVPEAADGDEMAERLASLLADAGDDVRNLMVNGFQIAADLLDLIPPELQDVDRAHGWVLVDRPALGPRIDEALSEFDSVGDLRTQVRRKYYPDGKAPFWYRPGDTYSAPPLGSRHRALYEALARTEANVLTLNVDPGRSRIQTKQGWIDLPPSALRDKAWWSGSGLRSTGRPQVRAWWAAGYVTPQLTLDDEGNVTAAQFTALPGRSEWLAQHETDHRLALGRYTVPSEPDTPYHAAFTYGGPSAWDMSDEEAAELRTTLAKAPPSTTTERDNGMGNRQPTVRPAHSDEQQIDLLVAYLRDHGETGRPRIEAFFEPSESGLSEKLKFGKWLSNLLAKARRQGKISNIGTRKQPRWVATGTAAHLTAELTSALGKDRHGNQVEKMPAPKLSPGEPVPAQLCRDVIRHTFPHLGPQPASPGARLTDAHHDERFLTVAGMRAVLAGRALTEEGVAALLLSIRLAHESTFDEAASAAAPHPSDMAFDEDEILAL